MGIMKKFTLTLKTAKFKPHDNYFEVINSEGAKNF